MIQVNSAISSFMVCVSCWCDGGGLFLCCNNNLSKNCHITFTIHKFSHIDIQNQIKLIDFQSISTDYHAAVLCVCVCVQ